MTEFKEERSYGQGAQGEKAAPASQKISTLTKLRYRFDNSIASSGAFVGLLALACLVLALIYSIIRTATEPLYLQDPAKNFSDLFWSTIAQLFLGAGRADADWFQRIMALTLWATTITLTATITGFVVTKMNSGIANLKKGRSAIIESGHTLILGWSNRVFPLLNELAIANQNVRKPLVVIFADLDREFMEDEIAARTSGLGKLRVVTRRGDVTNPADLARANVSGAKSVVVLDPDESGDASIVSTVLAVKSVNANKKSKVIAEVDDANTADALVSATNGQVIPVRSHDVIARVTAQASRQPGLAAVLLDLLDFDGDEIYFADVPALVGRSYADAILAFNKASVLGLIDADGTVSINPAQSTAIKAGTRIIAIAEDDDKVVYTGVREDLAKSKVTKSTLPAKPAENLLFVGWSSMGRAVLSELAGFLPKGSTVHIIAQKRFVDPAEFEGLKFGSLKVTTAAINGDIEELIAAASAKHYDEIIVLGYRNAIAETEADAQTMLTMLQLNQLFGIDGNGVEPTRLVAEILDSRKADLARVAASGDLVVSDNLAALLIAQVSENPALAAVFEDLFDAEGASLNVVPIESYVKLGTEVEFGELVAIARNFGQSAIGYRVGAHALLDAATGVLLNPSKTEKFTPVAGDALVVVGSI